MKFNKLNIKVEILNILKDLEYLEMTPIQEKAIPFLIEGSDLIGQAKTGSGKTAAFAITILEKIILKKNPDAIILCPTRELAEQVATEVRKLARLINNVKVLTICGGSSKYHQINSLEHGANIIVGTPGRVKKLISEKYLNLSEISTLVLDEADRMLDMGFYEDIMSIIDTTNKDRQTVLFSATFPEEIKNIAKDIQVNPKFIKVESKVKIGDLDQVFIRLSTHKDKNKLLLKTLAHYNKKTVLIFCKTKILTDKVADFLSENDIIADSIHGDIDQNKRTSILTEFSNNSLPCLVATDVAARGIDIKELPLVINYDFPNDLDTYTHRIGRTGRANQKGISISFILDRNLEDVSELETLFNEKFNIKSEEDFIENPEYKLKADMKTIYISGGKKNKLRPGDILGALIKEANIENDSIGKISINNIISYVAVKREFASIAVEKLNNGKIKNKKFKVGIL